MEYFLDTLKMNDFENTTLELLNKLSSTTKAEYKCLIKDEDTKELNVKTLYLGRLNNGNYFWTDNNFNVIGNFWTPSIKTSKALGNIIVVGVKQKNS